MEAIIKLSTQISLLTQELKRKQLAYSRHQRVANHFWNPYRPMEQVQYVGNPCLNTYQSGWPHHSHLSWETSQNPPLPPHEELTNLEEATIELAKCQVELAKFQFEMHKSQAQFMDETRAIFQIQSTQLKRLEAQIGQMAKINSKDRERSLPTIEELIREEKDAKEFNSMN